MCVLVVLCVYERMGVGGCDQGTVGKGQTQLALLFWCLDMSNASKLQKVLCDSLLEQ